MNLTRTRTQDGPSNDLSSSFIQNLYPSLPNFVLLFASPWTSLNAMILQQQRVQFGKAVTSKSARRARKRACAASSKLTPHLCHPMAAMVARRVLRSPEAAPTMSNHVDTFVSSFWRHSCIQKIIRSFMAVSCRFSIFPLTFKVAAHLLHLRSHASLARTRGQNQKKRPEKKIEKELCFWGPNASKQCAQASKSSAWFVPMPRAFGGWKVLQNNADRSAAFPEEIKKSFVAEWHWPNLNLTCWLIRWPFSGLWSPCVSWLDSKRFKHVTDVIHRSALDQQHASRSIKPWHCRWKERGLHIFAPSKSTSPASKCWKIWAGLDSLSASITYPRGQKHFNKSEEPSRACPLQLRLLGQFWSEALAFWSLRNPPTIEAGECPITSRHKHNGGCSWS